MYVHWVRFVLLFILMLCLSCSQETNNKHIILIVTDDQAEYSDDILDQVMPNVYKRIKSKGVHYTNYTCSSPYCSPSRASLLTGLYPHNHGHKNNASSYKDFHSKFDTEHLGIWMQEANYTTLFAGKYFNPGFPHDIAPNHIPSGWDHFMGSKGAKYWGTHVVASTELDPKAMQHPISKSRSEAEVDFIVEHIQAEKDPKNKLPLFIYFAPFEPHTQGKSETQNKMYSPEQHSLFVDKSINKSEFNSEVNTLYRSRLRSLKQLDTQIGRLLDSLEHYRILHDSYIIFTSDNGFMLGQKNILGKQQPYKPAAVVPFYVASPETSQISKESRLITTVDIAPTLLYLAKYDKEVRFDGRHIFHNKKRKWVYSEMFEEGQSELPNWYSIRSASEMLVEFEHGRYEYYNLENDPEENTNLFNQHKHQDLIKVLDTFKKCNQDCF